MVLGGLVFQVGTETVLGHLQALGWRIVPVLGIAISWHVSNTFAWQACFDNRRTERPGFWRLLYIKLAGEAVGNVTPASLVGGELAKVYLLRRRLSATLGLPSLVVNKTIEFMTGVLFAVAGTALAFHTFDLTENIRFGLVAAVCASALGVGIVYFKQRRNTFGWFLDVLKRLRITALEKRREQIQETDRNIAEFYGRNPGGFATSFGLHGLSWILGTFELCYILFVLDAPFTFGTAFLLASLSALINTAFFFVPSGVGVFEGGHVFLFHLLGLDPALGLMVGLLRRVRKIFWVVVGFALMLLLKSDRVSAVALPPRDETMP